MNWMNSMLLRTAGLLLCAGAAAGLLGCSPEEPDAAEPGPIAGTWKGPSPLGFRTLTFSRGQLQSDDPVRPGPAQVRYDNSNPSETVVIYESGKLAGRRETFVHVFKDRVITDPQMLQLCKPDCTGMR